MAPPAIAALSAVSTVEQAADYAHVVAPHLPQLQHFYDKLVSSLANAEQLQQFYASTNPLVTAFVFSLALAPIFLVASEVNRNYSQVDRFWSILPTVYAVHYAVWAHVAGAPHDRTDIIAVLGLIWSARLTFNYWRRGGYNIGSEDYRWNIIKAQIHPAIFFLFNVTFISTIQSVLLFCIHLPTYILLNSARVTGEGVTTTDYAFAGAMLTAILTSAVADQQQWNYHAAKTEYQQKARVPQGYTRRQMECGFNTTGLFSLSRHPNFLAEQSIWVLLFLWSAYETKTLVTFGGIGAFGYLALFQGSTWLTEKITAGKYPEYKEYQKRVGRFFPSPLAAFTEPLLSEEKQMKRSASGKRRSAGGKSK